MKTFLYIISGLGIGAIILFSIRSQIAPNFSIEGVDNLSKKGTFIFSGTENSFGIGQSKSVAGRNGYVVETGSSDNKSVFFKLYKNGDFIADFPSVIF